MLLMRWCCWCNVAADALLLLMRWCVDAAAALMLLKCWCCRCTVAANVLLLQIRWCCLCAVVADALMLQMYCSWWFTAGGYAPKVLMCQSCWCADLADVPILLIRWSCWCTDAHDALMLMMQMPLNQDQDSVADLSIAICSSFHKGSRGFPISIKYWCWYCHNILRCFHALLSGFPAIMRQCPVLKNLTIAMPAGENRMRNREPCGEHLSQQGRQCSSAGKWWNLHPSLSLQWRQNLRCSFSEPWLLFWSEPKNTNLHKPG